ncbi:MAG: serine/threonine-protein kinase [Polyangiaceae bacterium]
MPVQLEAVSGLPVLPERVHLARARVGTVLKQKWHLDQLLGVGGMAAVYAATHRNKKRVAIKMLHAELSLDEAIRKRFRREGYIANSVGQRGAVAVDYDDVSDEGLAFLVMELLDGETIEQRWLRKGRVLSPHEALSMVDQLLETLGAAHAAGIVHRDLKPENMFLTRDGIVKVLDFGIARVRELSTPQTTLAGSAIGTPAFMSPEQARGRWQDVDGRSDLWAVGATLYTLLSGKFVHSGESAHETLALAATRPARSLAAVRPDLHPSLIQLVDKALSYDKSARFPEAASMQHALRVTFGEMEGGAENRAGQLSIPDLQSIPASRAITLRNLTAPPSWRMSGQPTVKGRRGHDPLWLALLAAAALLLLGFVWLRSRAEVSALATPMLGATKPPSPAVAPHGAGGAPPRAATIEPTEPKAIRVDDLPQEPVKPGPHRR